MKTELILKYFVRSLFGLVFLANVAYAGATLTVNSPSSSFDTCDDKLSVSEALELARGATNMRSMTTGEKDQVSGATWVVAIDSPPCALVGWRPINGIGANFADDIVFTNDVGTIFGMLQLGKNDDMDGLRPDGQKIVLNGTGLSAPNNGLTIEPESGSQVRNLIIRNYPTNGIFAQALNGAKFEGLEIFNNGANGMSIGFAGGTTNKNSRNVTIGGGEPQQRNKIHSNGADGISIISSPRFDRGPDEGIFILNNLIGTKDGVSDNGNAGRGISLLNAFGIIIGDSTGATQNIISGNNNDGIALDGPGAISNVIIDNYIGTNESAGARLGNSASGIALLNSAGSTADFITTGPNKIGMPGLGNVISANNYGIFIADPNTSLNRIQGNLIGTNSGGNADLGNNADGIYFVNGTFDNQIGGTENGQGNLIAYNANGIKADSGVRNFFRGNRIFSNDNLGIDLAPAGVTPNDAGDGDSGPNNLQNYPVITFINSQPGSVTLNGTLNSTPNQTFSIDFYGNGGVNASGFGEGRNFLGTTQVTTDSAGNANFFGLSLASTPSAVGSWVTATATDSNNNTSEFSRGANTCGFLTASPVSATYGVAGGGGNFTVVYSGGCNSYTAQGSASWITVAGVSAGTVTYTVAPNTGAPRSGFVNVNFNSGTGPATFSFLVSQSGGCTYNLSHFTASYPAGGTNSDGLTLGAGVGCVWTAVPNAAWIHVIAGSSGSGNGTVTWSVDSNTGPARQGTLTIAGQTFTINQANGCTYNLSHFSASYPAAGLPEDAASLTSGVGCVWTAVSNNPTWIIVTGGASGSGNGIVHWAVTANTGPARQGTLTIANQTFTINQGAASIIHAPFDFDGDHKTDLSIFRSGPGQWWYQRSSDAASRVFTFGLSSDKLAPVDFTGDGKTDIAFWRPSTGEWFILRSEDSSFYSFPFGANGDIPAPADFDGDGKADPAVFRPSTATWYILKSSTGTATIQQFGATGDVPAVADYDGDGKADLAIYRTAVGQWWFLRSSTGVTTAFTFGTAADKPVQGDYTGDGKADPAFWRPSTGEWFVLRSENNSYFSFVFGTTSDIPSPGDFDGDGKFDEAVFRPSTGTWYVQRSTLGIMIQQFGQNGDLPVPNSFVH